MPRSLVFCALLALAIGGCAASRRPLGPLTPSRLAGLWIVEDFQSSTTTLEEVSRGRKLPGAHEREVIRIRPDGTFDWTGTPESLLSGLRRRGDQKTLHPLSDDTFVVEWSDYAPTHTTVLIRATPSSPTAEAFGQSQEHTRFVLRDIELVDDDHAVYWEIGPIASGGQHSMVMSLRRTTESGSGYRPFTFPSPGEAVAAENNLVDQATKAGNKYLFASPAEVDGPLPLVAIVCSDVDHPKDQWLPMIAKHRCAILVPHLSCGRDYEFGAYDAACTARDCKAIRDCLATVRSMREYSKVVLIGEFFDAALAHLIWQTDNGDLDALITCNGRFRAWNAELGGRVDRKKPIHILTAYGPGGDHGQAARDWYAHRNFAACEYEELGGNPADLEARLVELLDAQVRQP